MSDSEASASPSFPPLVALIIAGCAVSTGAIFARMAESHPLVTSAYRVGLATLFLLPFSLTCARKELFNWPRRSWAVVILSGTFLAAHFAAWITSLEYTRVANSVVLVNTSPIWVALLTPLVTRERVAPRIWFCLLLTSMGAFIITGVGLGEARDLLRGEGLALVGGVAAALYLLLGRRLRSGHSLLAYITVCYGAAALILWTLVLALGLPIKGFSSHTWWAFLGMALISQVVGHSSYNWALKYLGAGVVAISLLFEPVGSSLLAWLSFGEYITWTEAGGAVLVLLGIYLAATRPGKKA